MKKNRAFFLLGLVLLLALGLRTWRLNRLELFGDELDVGYQAYSILKTGRDSRGNFLPVYISSFSESRAPLFLYSAVPSVLIFGLNEWGVRLTAVFWGLLDIIMIYLLAEKAFKDKRIALLSAFFLAVTPWHIHYSRVGFEVTLLLFLVMGGTYFFLKGIEKNRRWLFLSLLLFALSFYTYNTANIFVPLLLLFLVLTNAKACRRKLGLSLSALAIFSIIVFPLGLKIVSGQAASRFNLISIFSDKNLIYQVIEKRRLNGGSWEERLAHNKLTAIGKAFFSNYLTAFSPQFLFVSGDPNPRHTPPGVGLLPWALLVPLLVGFLRMSQAAENDSGKKLFFCWLFLAPIASALTTDGGNQATRLFLMLPPLMVFSAGGILRILEFRAGKIILIGLSALLAANLFSFFHEVFVHYPRDQFRYWHYGYKEIVLALKGNQDICRRVYINNHHEPFLIRYLFWEGIDPKWFLANFKDDKENEKFGDYFAGFRVGDAYFGEVMGVNKPAVIAAILKQKNSCYIAFQGDEVPGDWDLSADPFAGTEVIKKVNTPLGAPYIYLLKGN